MQASKISLKSKGNLIILDDDDLLQLAWETNFKLAIPSSEQIKLTYFKYPEEFIRWYQHHQPTHTTFLIDYDLGAKLTGLDVIEQLGIAKRSILVTSHYDSTELVSRCKALELTVIPKQDIFNVPIVVEH